MFFSYDAEAFYMLNKLNDFSGLALSTRSIKAELLIDWNHRGKRSEILYSELRLKSGMVNMAKRDSVITSELRAHITLSLRIRATLIKT